MLGECQRYDCIIYLRRSCVKEKGYERRWKDEGCSPRGHEVEEGIEL